MHSYLKIVLSDHLDLKSHEVSLRNLICVLLDVERCEASQPLIMEPLMESRITEDPLAALLPHYIKKSNVDPYLTRNVTTQVGQTVYMHCIVNLVGDRTVRKFITGHCKLSSSQ